MVHTQPTIGRDSYFSFGAASSEAELHAAIAAAVMRRISARRLARARAAACLFGAVAALGAALLVPAIEYTAAFAEQTGFTSYASLLLSDGTSVLGYWRPLALSLAESAPLVGSALVLAALLVCGYSLMRLVDDLTIIKTYRHAIS